MPEDQPAGSANRELAAQIVVAYLRRNQIAADQIAALISAVYEALTGLGKHRSGSRTSPNPGRADTAICWARLRRLCRMWLARPDASPASDDSTWPDRAGI